ncbi:MFS transporter [Williamsia sp. M5A3_1d]
MIGAPEHPGHRGKSSGTASGGCRSSRDRAWRPPETRCARPRTRSTTARDHLRERPTRRRGAKPSPNSTPFRARGSGPPLEPRTRAPRLVATIAFVPSTPKPAEKSSILEPIRALRHRSLATTSVTGLLYNWGFFTILGYAPFLMNLSALKLGAVFFCWGILVAIFAVFGAPVLKSRFGTPKTLYGALVGMALACLVIGIWSGSQAVVIGATIASGIFVGLNNTLVTTAVMSIAPVQRSVASATYGFVRFIGGGLAPFAAGKLVEHYNDHVPFILGAAAVLVAAVVLSTVHGALTDADTEEQQPESHERAAAERAVTEVPAVEGEAVMAETALREDRAVAQRH